MTWGMQWGTTWGGVAAYDYRDIVKRRLWKHLERAPNVNTRAMLIEMAETWNILDLSTVEVINAVGIEQAKGDELDEWGAMVGFPRLGAADALYRRSIKAAARKLLAGGTLGDFYDVVELVSPGTKVSIAEGSASILIWVASLSSIEQSIVGSLFAGLPGRGIGASWIEHNEQVFTWGHSDGDVPVEYSWDYSDGSIPAGEKAGFGYSHVI
jgi:hypothetical protein